MNRKWTPHIIAVAAFVVFIVLGLACASAPYAGPDAEVTYVEYNIRKTQGSFRGYKEDNPSNYKAGDGFKVITFLQIKNGELQIDSSGGDYMKFNIETVNELYPLFEMRFKNTSPEPSVVYVSVHPNDPANPKRNLYFRLDRIVGLISYQEAQAIVARQEAAYVARVAAEAERASQEETQRQAKEQAKKAEQERLANLYRQAGNNLGNLRNTSRRYGMAFGTDYLTTTYNFGDGNYIEQDQTVLGLSFSPKTGTYRVNGDTVIFRSSEGEYKAGTIIGTALNIDGTIYR